MDTQVVDWLRSIGATKIGTVCIITHSDLLGHFDDDTYNLIRQALLKIKIPLRSEATDLKNRVATPFGAISNIPVKYLQVLGVISHQQREVLESRSVLTWQQLGNFDISQLTEKGQPLFTTRDTDRLRYILRRHLVA